MLLKLLEGRAGGKRRKLGRGAYRAGRITGGSTARQSLLSKRGAPVLNVALGAGVRPFELNELGSHCGEGRAALGGSHVCHATYRIKSEATASDIMNGLRCQYIISRPASALCVPELSFTHGVRARRCQPGSSVCKTVVTPPTGSMRIMLGASVLLDLGTSFHDAMVLQRHN